MSTPLHRNRWVQLVLGLAVSIGCLWWAAGGLLSNPDDRARIQDAFTRANYATLPPMVAGVALFYLIKAWRWRLLLKPVGDFHTVRDLLPYVMIGFAANNLLPARIGELVRPWALGRREKISRSTALATVIVERVVDMFSILLVLAVGLALHPFPRLIKDAGFAALATNLVLLVVLLVIERNPAQAERLKHAGRLAVAPGQPLPRREAHGHGR